MHASKNLHTYVTQLELLLSAVNFYFIMKILLYSYTYNGHECSVRYKCTSLRAFRPKGKCFYTGREKCTLYMYHSSNRWRESHKTAATLIKARFLTSIVGDMAKRCGDIPSTVPQPPEILKANTLWVYH